MKSLLIFLFFLTGAGTAALLSSCQNKTSDQVVTSPLTTSEFYFKQMKDLKIDVVYETGAEPFVGATAAGLNYWDITLQNLQALFNGRSVNFQVPKTLEEMTLIPSQARSVWSTSDAINLATQYRSGESAGTSGKIFVAFVKGYAAKSDGSANQNVIGFSVSGTSVILMFKQVIQSTGALPNGPVPKFVEQSTIVHELAHAIGLVNNGLPLTSAHHDSANGAHCSNPNCVMYYLNEGKDALATFIDRFKDSQTAVMFDNYCLNDAVTF